MIPVDVVQPQLDAYNAHDLERVLATCGDSVRVYRPPAPELVFTGKSPRAGDTRRTQQSSTVQSGESAQRGRRGAIRWFTAALGWALVRRLAFAQQPGGQPATPERRWYDAAAAMQQRALSWGDQPFGAVLVMAGAIAGEGPSRVVLRKDPNAHAEREAIKDAQRRLERTRLDGSVLYSTSRPCRDCERAAALAGVSRMIHGEALTDAGPPSP